MHREYYLNDAGAQLDRFRDSLFARYSAEEPPEDGYQGQYLIDMAAQLHAELGDEVSPDDASEWGHRLVVQSLHDDLARVGVHFDTWFSERALHERGDVDDVLAQLTEKGFVYDNDGARWLRSTDFGDQRDRVLVRSDGSTTYLCNDLAYHRDKFRRGFTHLIDIWGADHHGQVKSLQSGMEALGFEAGEPEIILGQFVKVVKDGREMRMSRRTGNIVTLADILDEVDPDVARMTFLLQGIDTAQTFDLDVVTEQSRENPVYYVQYAHARIASIGRKAASAGVALVALDEVDLSRLVHEREDALLRALANYPDALHEAAETRAPQKVSTWVRDFASEFHGFYRDCKVLSDDTALTQARLWLTEACRTGLANALGVLGVNAPDEMTRLDRRRGIRGMNEFDRSLLPASATVDADGRVAVAGVDLAALAEQFGTPLFVYDEDDIRARCRAYRAALGDGVAYASKAFLCTAMARLVARRRPAPRRRNRGRAVRRARSWVPVRAHRLPRQQQVDGRAAARARSRRRTDRGRLGRRAHPDRGPCRSGSARAPRAHPGHSGRGSAHARVHRDG